jgi:hypothetical protein
MMEFHEEIGGGGSQRRGWCMDPIHDTPALAISPSHIPCPACPKFRKNDWDRITFFYNSKLNFYFILFCFKDTTLFYLILKFQKLIHVFDNVRPYPNSQKTYFGTLVL